MPAQALPPEWVNALASKRVTSIRRLADASGISVMAASRLVKGEGTSAETVRRVAEELFGGDRNAVWTLHGSSVRDHGDWVLPEEASVLTDEQRRAVVAVVRAMLPEELKTGGVGERRSGPDNVREFKKPPQAPRGAPKSKAARQTGKAPSGQREE